MPRSRPVASPKARGAVPRVDAPALCAVACFFGGVRLIDNTVLVP
jgi:pantothenate synthetase